MVTGRRTPRFCTEKVPSHTSTVPPSGTELTACATVATVGVPSVLGVEHARIVIGIWPGSQATDATPAIGTVE